jgi:hypothetical protein
MAIRHDPGAGSREILQQRCRENSAFARDAPSRARSSRSAALPSSTSWRSRLRVHFHIVCLCRVGPSGKRESGQRMLDEHELAWILSRSTFSEDRKDAE